MSADETPSTELDPETVFCWTDGSTRPRNPGYGASAYLIVGEQVWTGTRWLGPDITNNQAELMGIYDCLYRLTTLRDSTFREARVHPNASVVIHSDSEWSINAVTGEYKVTKNLDFIERIRQKMYELGDVRLKWVRGHAGDPYNEFVDKMAHLTSLIPKHNSVQEYTREQFTKEGREFLTKHATLVETL